MVSSENLLSEAAELRAEAAEKDDKSFFWVGTGVVLAILGSFASILTLSGWYLEYELGAAKAPVGVQAGYAAMIFVAIVVIMCITKGIFLLYTARSSRKTAAQKTNASKIIFEAEKIEREAERAEAAQRERKSEYKGPFKSPERTKDGTTKSGDSSMRHKEL